MEAPDNVCSVDGPDGISPGHRRSQTITSPGRLGPALVLLTLINQLHLALSD